ncbi:hypothetical protein [Acinetobacter nosocomialis]|uniref:hypothetical protein n=1 Tax=Acinetobacter nosocomialis TaxID=106654 RepID=UPI0026EE6200|nr:hypothetical protein [Acinetobacter nosocomialis]MDO7220562.1 hypothetical protein [Acinetobacter nosocomialis]
MKLIFEENIYCIDIISDLFSIELIQNLGEIREEGIKVKAIGIIYTKSLEPVLVLPKIYSEDSVADDKVYATVLDVEQNQYKKYWRQIFKLLEACNKFNYIQANALDCYGQKDPQEYLTNFSIFNEVIDFYRKNGGVSRRVNEKSYSGKKINWNKTVAANHILLVDDVPIYTKTIGVKKFNSDDNILNKYLFVALDIISDFISLNGYSKRNNSTTLNILRRNAIFDIKRIRSKIFSDQHLYCYELLIRFFQGFFCLSLEKNNLLIKNFNLVFESMVDNLFKKDYLNRNEKTKNILRKHKDGKIVDHVFMGDSLFKFDKNTIYVLDSKYYKNNFFDKYSIYKQKTYTRNIYDIYLENEIIFNELGIELVERRFFSYDFIPNYFIMPASSSEFINFSASENSVNDFGFIERINFNDCFFDRDTNLIFVLKVDLIKLIDSFLGVEKVNLKKIKEFLYFNTLEFLNFRYDFNIKIFDGEMDRDNYLIGNFYKLYGKFTKHSNNSIYIYNGKKKE